MKRQYHNFWINRYNREQKSYREVLELDPFDHWERNRMPEITAETNLIFGLEILYVPGEITQAQAFFERCISISERALTEDKLTTGLAESGFPLNRGVLLRAKNYALTLVERNLDNALLSQASLDFEKGRGMLHKQPWDSQGQAEYLAAVRVAIIVGDFKRAHHLLKKRKPFNWHQEEFALWKKLVETLEVSSPLDQNFREQFDEFFDIIRDPTLKPDRFVERAILSFELGVIRDKYLISSNGSIDWRRVIVAISA